MNQPAKIRTNQRLGKYRIARRLAEGGFANVYEAYDTLEGIRVALKIPHPRLVDRKVLDDFRKEARLSANLDHPNILSMKNANFIDGQFVMALPMGVENLADRLKRRLAVRTTLAYAEQMLDALACAHRRGIIHCDVKPENFILFPEERIRLADFGIAKVARRTIEGSGSGTVGYMAPEQAMGKPSVRSDVFSMGLVLFRMFSGKLPEWPFETPLPGISRLRSRFHSDLVRVLLRALELNPRRRYPDADQMLRAFRRVKRKAVPTRRTAASRSPAQRHWKEIKWRQFRRQHGAELDLKHDCHRCGGPVSEAMQACPWCGVARGRLKEETRFPRSCPRCRRGLKLDWASCPWCWGPAVGVERDRVYGDRRYERSRCGHAGCDQQLMRFMRYCPKCRTKVRRDWLVPGSRHRCGGCHWGVVPGFWSYCPWCSRPVS